MDSDDWSTGAAGPPLQGVQVQLINWDEGNYTVNDKPNPRGKKLLSFFMKRHFICFFRSHFRRNRAWGWQRGYRIFPTP